MPTGSEPTIASKPRILVVDDEATTRRVLTLSLRDAGFEVDEAETGEQAVERASAIPFDLALIDKNLPGISGVEAIEAIRRQSGSTQALLMTAYPSLESLEEARSAGALGYLLKPFDDLKRVVDLVRMVFSDGGKSAAIERTFRSVVDEIRRLKTDPPPPPKF